MPSAPGYVPKYSSKERFSITMNTRWLMLSIPFDGSMGALSSDAGWCCGGLINGCRSTPLGATDGSGASAPFGHVGTWCDPACVAVDGVGGPADESVAGDPVVHA